eukprot:TRINITY_DN5189_c1_g1_i1.p1 TRINITY_DN5189_c1_g1~~TRINITY_DN5189_c1_g1_i1.p1  ORF type:complete len:129 (+),score=19.64 TRINITY_DN5189_c1_g1_i1:296-682(+)
MLSHRFINQHLNVCIAKSEERKEAKTSGPQQKQEKPKPIAPVCYNIMTDKQLRELNKRYGLSTNGNRQDLIHRHREFVVRHNAECDSLNPTSDDAIAREINKTDSYQNFKQSSQSFFKVKSSSNEKVN